ncbi:hypothetical protein J6590_019377 [Homalodisca vitripennis]|nr:hypothetical protein J6590_019377 [Homalodisca vitripennis]
MILDGVYSRLGLQKVLVSDNGLQVTSFVLKQFYNSNNNHTISPMCSKVGLVRDMCRCSKKTIGKKPADVVGCLIFRLTLTRDCLSRRRTMTKNKVARISYRRGRVRQPDGCFHDNTVVTRTGLGSYVLGRRGRVEAT